jgi:hypothetical protein
LIDRQDRISRLAGLNGMQWRVLLAAPFVLLMTWSRLGTRGYVRTLAATAPNAQSPLAAHEQLARAQQISYAFAVAVKYGPWRPQCLVRSLALGWLLGRHGVPFEMRIGVSEEQADFGAHAWIEHAGVILNDRMEVGSDYKAFTGDTAAAAAVAAGGAEDERPRRVSGLRIFDLCVESEIPLPGLSKCSTGKPLWRVHLADVNDAFSEIEPFHTWRSPDGAPIMTVARRGEDYLLEVPGLARFRVDPSAGRIDALAAANCTERTLAHLVSDQVLPRVVCHRGRVVLHASAVMLEDGRAVAFSGATGRGKSTLAAAFCARGFSVLSDDCLLLEPGNDGVLAIPAYPSLRLWPDSLAAMRESGWLSTAKPVEMAHYSKKSQLLVHANEVTTPESWPRLAALFLLDLPADDAAVHIEPAGGKEGLMALVENGFALDVVDKPVVARNFERSGRLANALPIYRLHYARDFQNVSCVVAKIRNFLASVEGLRDTGS